MFSGRVESLLPGGESLLCSDGKTFLLSNAVPGDLIRFEATVKQRGAMRARLLGVVEPSKDRVTPPCPVASECGGCALQYLDSSCHIAIKSAWVKDAFRHCLTAATEWLPAAAGDTHGRRRLRWFIGCDDAGAFPGFRAANSHRVVRHDSCLTATHVLNAVRAKLEERVWLDRFESVQALHLDDGIHLILEHGKVGGDFVPPFDQVEGLPVQWWHRNGHITRPLTKPAQMFHDIVPTAAGDDLSIRIGPDDFIQGQLAGNREMVQQVIDWCAGARFVVDLFSGVGNLSLPVAAGGSRVIGAELNPASVKAANANAKRLNLDARYSTANLFENFDCEPFAGSDVLILDPPRRGAKKVCSMMGRLLPEKIVMINCDVASGGRDGEMLQSLGYRLQSLRALDLFPYTGHVEAMSLWLR